MIVMIIMMTHDDDDEQDDGDFVNSTYFLIGICCISINGILLWQGKVLTWATSAVMVSLYWL